MRKVILTLLALAAAGCSNGSGGSDASTDSPAGDAGSGGCVTDLDCPNVGDRCFFAINGGCTVAGRTGTCLPYSQTTCDTPNLACGCDGTPIADCAPAGYVTRASMNAGACPPSDAGPDVETDDGATDDGATDDGATDASGD